MLQKTVSVIHSSHKSGYKIFREITSNELYTDLNLHLILYMFSYSDVPLFRVSTDFRIFGQSLTEIVESNSFISSENWLLGDKDQSRHT